MLIGYARTSTLEQEAGLEAQLRDLKAAGCKRIRSEQVSSLGRRPELERALDDLRANDVFVVCKIDRLARSVRHLMELVDEIERRGASLRILNLGFDSSTPTGRLMLQTLGAVAEFEVAMMKERQREGIQKARSDGKYKGRKPTARAQAAEVKRLAAEGMGATAISKKLGIGRASVYRCLETK